MNNTLLEVIDVGEPAFIQNTIKKATGKL